MSVRDAISYLNRSMTNSKKQLQYRQQKCCFHWENKDENSKKLTYCSKWHPLAAEADDQAMPAQTCLCLLPLNTDLHKHSHNNR